WFLECLLPEPLVDDNSISGRSLSRHSILKVDRTSRESLEADSGSSPSAYSILVGPTIPSSQMGLIDKAPVSQQVGLYNHKPNDHSSCCWCTLVHKAHRGDNFTWDIEATSCPTALMWEFHHVKALPCRVQDAYLT
nr:hypothetical protein [Tanacetum cinerariifolium]